MRILLFLLATLYLLACTSSNKQTIFSPANLDSYIIRIPAAKDTVLRTPKGAVLRIRKGTFPGDVELEIKEAYTMKDILLAGLTTEADGAPLRSGGMIYINTKEGIEAVLQKPIDVVLPTNGVEQGMTLFKGEETRDGIDWKETDTLQPTVDEAQLAAGKSIFISNCATCHAIRKVLTGPALAAARRRGPWTEKEELVRWIHNPGAFVPTTAYTRQLTRMYNGQLMPSFPQLSVEEIESLFAFVENEAQKVITDTFQLPALPVVESWETTACQDTTYTSEQDSLFISNMAFARILNDTSLLDPKDMQMRSGFTDNVVSDGAYRFQIQTLGWYNVDVRVAGLPGTTICELKVQLQNQEVQNFTVYAFFPQQKNLSVGISHGKGEFGFEKVNGRIPLYLGERATVIAFGNRGDQFWYGTTHFAVNEKQSVAVLLQPATEEAFLQKIRDEKLEGINLDVVRQQMKITPCANDSAKLEL